MHTRSLLRTGGGLFAQQRGLDFENRDLLQRAGQTPLGGFQVHPGAHTHNYCEEADAYCRVYPKSKPNGSCYKEDLCVRRRWKLNGNKKCGRWSWEINDRAPNTRIDCYYFRMCEGEERDVAKHSCRSSAKKHIWPPGCLL